MSDWDVIKEIEEEFGISLPKKSISYLRKGRTSNKGDGNGYAINKKKNVVALRLERLNLESIPQKLLSFNELEFLFLRHNRIKDYSQLVDLKNLKRLDVSFNEISDITSFQDLIKLKNLNTLNFTKNKIEDLFAIKNFSQLTTLFLGHNNIENVAILKNLGSLINLYLHHNKIKDISSLEGLKKLEILTLSNNCIYNLPSWIAESPMEFHTGRKGPGSEGIFLRNNPLRNPPKKVAEQGKKELKIYFDQIKQHGIYKIHEGKLMIVGEPGAGKTSLMNKLINREFKVPNKKQKSTLGIDVRSDWSFQPKFESDFKSHIWDFGGQNIQYMLHQFFLTSDCVYVLMAEKRKELTNFDYWLNIINILGKNSPVIIVFNEININSVSSFVYDEKKYKDLFPNLNIQRLDVNLSNLNDGRFDVLQKAIQEKLFNLEHVGHIVPSKWINIKIQLEEAKVKKYIPISRYYEICNQNGIYGEDIQMLILRYFHLLGIALHYSNDTNLSDVIFLDPNWTVEAIYMVLAHKPIEENNGIFEKTEIEKLWKAKGYDYTERKVLLQLMLKDKFDLCYKLPGKRNKFMVPLLIQDLKPSYVWEPKEKLEFRFQYPFMPKGILSRFIVKMHKYILDNCLWKEGVILKRNSSQAQVVERKTKEEGLKIIEITIAGLPNDRKEFLTLIREEIRKIQDFSFPFLSYLEMVPCNCSYCSGAPKPQFYDYSVLENFLLKGHSKIQCQKSGGNMVDILSLVDAVGLKVRRIAPEIGGDLIFGELEQINQKLDSQSQKLDQATESILDKVEAESRNVISTILAKLEESERQIISQAYQEIDENRIDDMQLMQGLFEIYKVVTEIKDKELKQLALALKQKSEKSDSLKAKFKLTLPLIPGILKLEEELNLDGTIKKLWEKWGGVVF